MFKRVEKRRRKKEEEEELGLDEDMKEILGIQETDSEESASDPDDDSDGGSSDGEEGMDDDRVGENEDGDDEEGESADEGDADEEEEDPNVTVAQALDDPLYVVSVLPEVKACIICPGKLLKGAKMVQKHRESNGHKRRLKRFKSISAESNPKESAWDVLKQHAEAKPKLSMAPSTAETGLSKRAERKRVQQARRVQLREKRKEKRKKLAAKKAHTDNPGTELKPSSKPKSSLDSKSAPEQLKSPPRKKRRVDMETKPVGESPSKSSSSSKNPKLDASTTKKQARKRDSTITSTNPTPIPDKIADPITTSPAKTEESVTSIVRSTANRAKTARDRALSISKSAKKYTKGASRGKKPSRRKAVGIS